MPKAPYWLKLIAAPGTQILVFHVRVPDAANWADLDQIKSH